MPIPKYKMGTILDPVKGMRRANIADLYQPKTPRLLLTSVTLPSQYNAFATLTEYAKYWFLEKFPPQFFNSVFVDGSKSFDQFRMFSDIHQQLKRTNPLLAITPTIDTQHNRQFVDTNMELGGHLRRTRMEGVFFSDNRPGKHMHLALQFKTILMTFTYKMRLDTKAQQLDMIEFIKYKHRAGMTETATMPLEIHVPRKIICQIAFDNGMLKEDYSDVKNPDDMLRYLNSHSSVPVIYKRRNATGTYEFFIRVENCVAHTKAEFPQGDDGERVDHEHMNFTLDFNTEVEMTAPYNYTYYSEMEQNIINSGDLIKDETAIVLMRAARADLPECNEAGWNRMLKTEYIVETEDLKHQPIEIKFAELLEGELRSIIDYTKDMHLNPSLFLDFIIFNDGRFKNYELDWDTFTMKITERCTHPGFVIGMYIDMKYVNNVKIHHNFSDGYNAQDSFRTTSRIGNIEN